MKRGLARASWVTGAAWEVARTFLGCTCFFQLPRHMRAIYEARDNVVPRRARGPHKTACPTLVGLRAMWCKRQRNFRRVSGKGGTACGACQCSYKAVAVLRPSSTASSTVRGLRQSPMTWSGPSHPASACSSAVSGWCPNAVTIVSTPFKMTG